MATSSVAAGRTEWPQEITARIRRVVSARVNDPMSQEDLVQETVARLLERGLDPTSENFGAYAAAAARNVVISQARTSAARGRNSHRLLDPSPPERPDERAVRNEERRTIVTALARMPQADRDAMFAHDVFEINIASLARTLKSSPGSVSVRLARARAKLRVEYLVASRRDDPPRASCRRVLTALSARDRRRQIALDAAGHVAECDYCAGQKIALTKPFN